VLTWSTKVGVGSDSNDSKSNIDRSLDPKDIGATQHAPELPDSASARYARIQKLLSLASETDVRWATFLRDVRLRKYVVCVSDAVLSNAEPK
jgi:hypothetical protein